MATGLGTLPLLFVALFAFLLPIGLAPDALDETSHNRVGVVITPAMAAIAAFQLSIR